jgi:hypothetical protein
MNRPPSALLLLVFASAFASAACAHKPPLPPAPEPVVQAPPPKPPPPPAAPKCESLDEGCKAGSDTKLPVGASGYAFTPPEGWTYAKESDAAVTQTSNAVLALTTYDVSDPKTATANRDAAMALLLGKLGQLDKPASAFWAKPADTLAAGDLKVALYADAAAKRAGKEVTLAAFDVPLPDKKTAILGASFDPNDDTSDSAKRAVAAVTSLSPAPAKSP